MILRTDKAFSQLGWPADIEALIVVDKIWNTTGDAEIEDHEDSVKLYVLTPLKLTKKGPP
ncbi:hypothetical protein ACFS4T_00025 [Pseudomonas lini]